MIHALYFNGLTDGTTRKREQLAIKYLAKRGIVVEHVPIDWQSDELFQDLLARLTKITEQKLKEHGKLLLIGSSAGGSLALNVFKQVDNKNLYAVTLCSRLHDAKLAWWDWRTMQRMAYIGTQKASQTFIDSVSYCTDKTIPILTKQDKQRIVIVRQIVDDVVPRPTMSIDGVQIHKVSAVGHGWGIGSSVRRLPEIWQSMVQ
jgi:hypothetical protein